jgi:hypothetical protein
MRIRNGKNADLGFRDGKNSDQGSGMEKNSDPGSGMEKIRIRDPVWKNSDPGSGINIPDPQHRLQTYLVINGRGGEGAEAEAELGASAQSVAALHNAGHVEGEDEHEGACAVRVADLHSFHPDPAF